MDYYDEYYHKDAYQDTSVVADPGTGTIPVAAEPLPTAPFRAAPAAATAAEADSFPPPRSSEEPRCSGRSPKTSKRKKLRDNVHRCLPGHVCKLRSGAREMTMQAGG